MQRLLQRTREAVGPLPAGRDVQPMPVAARWVDGRLAFRQRGRAAWRRLRPEHARLAAGPRRPCCAASRPPCDRCCRTSACWRAARDHRSGCHRRCRRNDRHAEAPRRLRHRCRPGARPPAFSTTPPLPPAWRSHPISATPFRRTIRPSQSGFRIHPSTRGTIRSAGFRSIRPRFLSMRRRPGPPISSPGFRWISTSRTASSSIAHARIRSACPKCRALIRISDATRRRA